MLIYLLFEPLKIEQQEFLDVPLLNMDNFTMYELDEYGLQTLMSGDKALRYSDRYVVFGVDFTDNSQSHISNMIAKEGLYKDDTIKLSGDVIFTRDDGVTFKSQTLLYDTKSARAETKENYVIYRDKSSMQGSSLFYDIHKEIMKSKNVVVKFQLKESSI